MYVSLKVGKWNTIFPNCHYTKLTFGVIVPHFSFVKG
jgi:hypothetical protein